MKVTKDHKKELSTTQQAALTALLSGSTDAEAAEVAGVARETVTRWQNNDPLFEVELNRGRKAIWRADVQKISNIRSKALTTVKKAVEGGDVKAAFKILEMSGGLPAPVEPGGFTDVDALIRADVHAAVQSAMDAEHRIFDARVFHPGEYQTRFAAELAGRMADI